MRYHCTTIRMAKIQKNCHHQMLMRVYSNRNFHSLLMGMQNGSATLEDSLTVSIDTKLNVVLTIQSSNHTPRYLPK